MTSFYGNETAPNIGCALDMGREDILILSLSMQWAGVHLTYMYSFTYQGLS